MFFSHGTIQTSWWLFSREHCPVSGLGESLSQDFLPMSFSSDRQYLRSQPQESSLWSGEAGGLTIGHPFSRARSHDRSTSLTAEQGIRLLPVF